MGRHVKKVLEDFRVDISRCREYEGENGFALIDLKNGERVFVMSNKGGVLKEHPIVLSGDDLSYIEAFDWVHTSNNSYMDKELSKLAGASKFLSYDFSGSYTDYMRNEYICRHVDSAFLSCAGMDTEEIKKLLKRMNSWGCPLLIATRGEEGVLLYDGKRYFEYKPELVRAVDTLGAGDSFAAGFLLSYLESRKNHELEEEYTACIEKAFKKGASMSAQTCMEYGAFGCGTDLV